MGLVEVPFWLSDVRIQHCCSCRVGHSCGVGSTPGPATFTCHGCIKKKKKYGFEVVSKNLVPRLPYCLNRLKMWCCHCCGSGHSCGTVSIPGPGISAFCRHDQGVGWTGKLTLLYSDNHTQISATWWVGCFSYAKKFFYIFNFFIIVDLQCSVNF